MKGRKPNPEREALRLFVHSQLNLDLTRVKGSKSKITLADLRKIKMLLDACDSLQARCDLSPDEGYTEDM